MSVPEGSYIICGSSSEGELTTLVSKRIAEGYRPVGGVAMVHWKCYNDRGEAGGCWWFSQALWREPPAPVEPTQ